MRSPLLHALLIVLLLLQGGSSAWAASRMAAASVNANATLAELPPCHRAMMKADMAKSHHSCCGTAQCHCVMSCGGIPVLALVATTPVFARVGLLLIEPAAAALPSPYYGPPLRPPALPLQS